MKLGSIVVNRNDGYKDHKRGLVHFLSMLDTFDEINYIDWNSPNGSFLWDIIDDIPKTGKIKHYVISPDVAKQLIPYENASRCNETMSRNIALRRSEADWVVSTSIDVIPPKKEDICSLISGLNDKTFYTISRRELPLVLFDKYSPNEWNNLREKAYELIPERYFLAKVSPNDTYSLINCCGDFQLAHIDLWKNIKGFEENMIFGCFSDTNVQKKSIINGFNLQALYFPPVFHIEHKPYSIDKNGERINSKEFHSTSYEKANNDVWRFVEFFEQTENNDDWGLNNIEIEYEII